MAKFKGKNSIRSTRYLAQQRANYRTQAFPENGGLGPEQVTDFTFAEKVLYGRVDRDLNAVIPLNEFIVPIASGRTNHPGAIDFVADALTEMMIAFRLACRVGKIPDNDQYLSEIEVFRGYQSPMLSYEEHAKSVMSFYNLMFVGQDEMLDEIYDIKQYVAKLYDFTKQYARSLPLTLTGYQLSRESNIFTSGLAFDISGFVHDNDEIKEDLFLNNPTFQYYMNMAKQYGFSVSKNVPWVLVADLASPGMLRYKEAKGLSSINSIFSLRYQKTVELDISLLREFIYLSFNEFVTINPYTKILKVCNGKTKSDIKRRYGISRDTMNSIINDNIIIELYLNIRNNEENRPLKESEINLISKNAKKIKDSLDIQNAIGYIEEQYRSIRIFKPGGLNSTVKKERQKKQREKFGTTNPFGGGY
jgi:hypothetical protein